MVEKERGLDCLFRRFRVSCPDEHALTIGECGSKEVVVASLGKFELATQGGDVRGEVADGEVGLTEVTNEGFEVFLAEVTHAHDAEPATGEVGDEVGADEKMAHRVEFLNTIAFAEQVLHTCLQDGSVGFIEKPPPTPSQGGGMNHFAVFFLAIITLREEPLPSPSQGGGIIPLVVFFLATITLRWLMPPPWEGVGGGHNILIGPEVYAVDGGGLGNVVTQYEEEFLAFAVEAYDMYLADVFQFSQGLGYVEHGRELHHHPLGVGKQLVLQFEQIGSAVFYVNGLASSCVATGGVDK